MRTIEESVVIALDGEDKNLYPYIPYVLQDLWEFGASPEIIINLIKKHKSDFENLKILDLGSGKGAVSINIATEFKCHCIGIDAVKEFVDESIIKAKEYNVEKYCDFRVGDIRTKLIDKIKFDIVILGALGPVFGDYYSTLTGIKKCLLHDGLIIIDEVLISQEQIKKSNKYIFNKIKIRCEELIKKEPKNRHLFENYIKNQEFENEVLEQQVICSTMVIRDI